MNRNTQSRFSVAPQVDIKRSIFDRSFQHKTTGNVGDLIPFFVDEVLPGDTFVVDTAFVARMTTLIKPVMDNAYIDIFYFAVPNRLLWDHWKEFCGENNNSPWADETEYTIPQLTAPLGGWRKGTIADYMGIPINVANISVNALPFRAYALIWNEWFRDQNVQEPCVVSKDDATNAGTNLGASANPANAELGGMPCKVNKFHDYFTSALPEPQKGDPVSIGVGGTADVLLASENANSGVLSVVGNSILGLADRFSASSVAGTAGSVWSPNASVSMSGASVNGVTPMSSAGNLKPVDLVADLSQATAITINELRLAFATQRLLERDARGGTRYTEVLRAHFGVSSPDARLQRPEYLGGKRVPVNMNQVLQMSASSADSPQGNTAAYSLTSDVSSSFTYSATEHCYILGLACVRTDHSYQQGIERMWSRKRRFDFYYPALANIGETAILNKEIFAQGGAADDQAFGYQEAWAEYRYKPNRISGAFRSQYDQSLDIWHYGDDYSELPTLSASWMAETETNVNRTLSVPSTTEDQMIFDFAIKLKCTRPMPIYSVPGLIDHN
nr:MAG TPA: major capsid protein [Microviridae sp.]